MNLRWKMYSVSIWMLFRVIKKYLILVLEGLEYSGPCAEQEAGSYRLLPDLLFPPFCQCCHCFATPALFAGLAENRSSWNASFTCGENMPATARRIHIRQRFVPLQPVDKQLDGALSFWVFSNPARRDWFRCHARRDGLPLRRGKHLR